MVRLRALEPEDLELLYCIENDQRLWQFGSTTVPYSRYALHEYIANASGDIYTDRQVRLIMENGQGDVVGIADLFNFDARHLRAEIGLVVKQEYRRHGYASAAVGQLERYAFDVLHLHQIYAVIDAANETTLSIFRKHGYTESVRLKDWLFDGRCYHDAIIVQTVSA